MMIKNLDQLIMRLCVCILEYKPQIKYSQPTTIYHDNMCCGLSLSVREGTSYSQVIYKKDCVQLLQECGVYINVVGVNSSHYFLCVWGEGVALYPCLPMFFLTHVRQNAIKDHSFQKRSAIQEKNNG